MLQHADDLSLLQAQIEYKKRLEAVMRELTSQEASLQKRIAGLKESMLQAQKDVDRLERASLASFFYYMTGQMDSVLTKERREAYTARIKYDTAMRELEAIQEDILETSEDLRDLKDCETQFDLLLEQKRQRMAQIPDINGSLLMEKEQLLYYLHSQEQELEEAIRAGTTSLRTMAQIQQSLNQAKDFSDHDTLRPAFWADHARQERIGQLQETVSQFQIQLQKFNKELSDVTIRTNLQFSIDRMLQFADSLFGNLLPDTPIPQRIREACTLASQTREHILSILRQLQNALEEVRHNQIHTRKEMDSIVLSTTNE